MAKQRNALSAGIFIVISVILVGVVVVAIRGLSYWTEPVVKHVVSFALRTDIGGLNVGDDVRVGGFKVGEVKRIDTVMRQDNEPEILVYFTMPRKYVIKKDTKVRVGGTLTGTSWLNFESLGRGERLDDQHVIAGLPNQTTDLLGNLSEASALLKETTIPNVNTTLDKVSALLNDNSPVFRETLANLAKTTGALKQQIPQLLDRVDHFIASVDKVVEDASGALVDIRSASSDVKQIGATARGIIVDNKSKLEGIVLSLKTTSDNLKNASSEIRHSPWRLLYKPDASEASNLNIFDAARGFAEGANELNTAAQALRDITRNKSATESEVRARLDQLDATFTKFNGIEQKLWQSVKE